MSNNDSAKKLAKPCVKFLCSKKDSKECVHDCYECVYEFCIYCNNNIKGKCKGGI